MKFLLKLPLSCHRQLMHSTRSSSLFSAQCFMMPKMGSVKIGSEEEFEQNVAISEKPLIVVHFYAEWAPQCGQMEDVVQELKNDSEYKNVQFFKHKKMMDRLDGANAPELTKKVKQLLSKALIIPSAEHPTEDLNSVLKQLINKAPCMLFMKGTPEEPRCGFSKQTIELLNKYNAEYSTFNILSNEEIRQGLKKYSNWPTYPQLYINGELIGGLDILKELAENGELETMLPKKQNLNERLEKLINKAPVMIFMKGSPETPRCGFSKTLVSILKEIGAVYESFDILQDEEVRQGLKMYSNWPTYPQVYVKGNLIGGVDIIKEMHESGELKEALLGK